MNLRILLLLVFSVGLVWISCEPGKEDKSQKITLTNSSSVHLTDKAISIARENLTVPEGALYPLLLSAAGDTIASQLDDLSGDGQWDELFFVADIPADQSVTLLLVWTDIQPEYTVRTGVKFGKRDSKNTPVYPKTSDTLYADQIHKKLGYQPYQTDGPMWENDKVGFRHYFDGRNAKDLFGKKVAYMSPESVGIGEGGKVEDNYHEMADWGRDILAVGNSAGLGGFALLINDEITRLGCVSGDTVTNVESSVFQIKTEGPVRSVMNFTYNNWKPVDDRNYMAEETVSIWPGMYAYQSAVKISGLQGDEKLAIGLVNINTDQPLTELDINEKYIALYTHDQQSYDKEWWLGMALIIPKDAYLGVGEAPETGKFTNSFFARMTVKEDTPVKYYSVGAWELSDEGFVDREYFVKYIEELAHQLAAEVEVAVD